MTIPVKIGELEFNISPYNTSKEKEILLRISFDNYTPDELLEILGLSILDIKQLSENAKKYLLYKFREISIGNEINIKYKCQHCGIANDGVIDLSGILVSSENDEEIKKIDIELTDENLYMFINKTQEEIDELDIDEFDILKEKVKNNQINYNFKRSCTCLKCRGKHTVDIGDMKYIAESLSEDTLMSLYKSYNFLNYLGKYSKLDIDSMYPFERSIFIGLVSNIKEDIAK